LRIIANRDLSFTTYRRAKSEGRGEGRELNDISYSMDREQSVVDL